MVTVSTPNSQIIDKHRGLNGVKLYLWYLHPSAAHVAVAPVPEPQPGSLRMICSPVSFILARLSPWLFVCDLDSRN